MFKTIGGYNFLFVVILKILDSILSIISLSLIYPLTSLLLDPNNFFIKLTKYLPLLLQYNFNTKVLILGIILLVYIIFRYFYGLFSLNYINSFCITQRFNWVNQLSFYFFNQNYLILKNEKSGKLVSEWYNDTYNASTFVTLFISLINDFTFLFTFLLFVIITNYNIGLLLLLLFISIFLFYHFSKRNILNKQSNKKITFLQEIMSLLTEIILHIKDIKIFQLHNITYKQVKYRSNNLKNLFIENANLSKRPILFSELFIVFLISLFFILLGLNFIKLIDLDLSLLILYFTLSLKSFSYTSQIIVSYSKIKIEFQSLKSLSQKLFFKKEFLKNKSISYDTINLNKIVISNLNFSYKNKINILENVNITIPLRKHILIIGNSGVGKSTFLDILVGLTTTTEGKILIYDNDENVINRDIHLFGYVSQDVGLFGESLVECICGNNVFDETIYNRIINLCNLKKINNQRQLFNVLSYSGGEKLRIALARALYYNRPILILDESLSSIEHTLEIKILENIKLFFPNITIFQVIHERTEFSNADFKLIFENKNLNIQKIN